MKVASASCMRLSILSVRGCRTVQHPDGMRVETVSESVGTGQNAFVPSARWQEGKDTRDENREPVLF